MDIQGAQPSIPFQTLDCVNFLAGDRYGYYRIVLETEPKTIKYLRFQEEREDPMPDIQGRRLSFKDVPPGSWNCATLHLDTSTGKFRISTLDTVALKKVDGWHDMQRDVLSFHEAISGPGHEIVQCNTKPLSSLRIKTPNSHPLRPGGCYPPQDKMFVDCTWWPTDVSAPAAETEIHRLIQSKDIAPNFLGHVTENNSRVIGYMTEYVPGRTPTISDLPACKAVLQKLHTLGIAYGDCNPEAFLVPDNSGRGVLLHSFGSAEVTQSHHKYELDLILLEMALVQKDLERGLDNEMVADRLLRARRACL